MILNCMVPSIPQPGMKFLSSNLYPLNLLIQLFST
jgi:hypothetical protein